MFGLSTWLCVLIVIVVFVGAITTWALCKSASRADKDWEQMMLEFKKEMPLQ